MKTYRDYGLDYQLDSIASPGNCYYIAYPKKGGKNIREILDQDKVKKCITFSLIYKLKEGDINLIKFVMLESSDAMSYGKLSANKKIIGYKYHVALEDSKSVISSYSTEHLNNALIKFTEFARKLELMAFM